MKYLKNALTAILLLTSFSVHCSSNDDENSLTNVDATSQQCNNQKDSFFMQFQEDFVGHEGDSLRQIIYDYQGNVSDFAEASRLLFSLPVGYSKYDMVSCLKALSKQNDPLSFANSCVAFLDNHSSVRDRLFVINTVNNHNNSDDTSKSFSEFSLALRDRCISTVSDSDQDQLFKLATNYHEKKQPSLKATKSNNLKDISDSLSSEYESLIETLCQRYLGKSLQVCHSNGYQFGFFYVHKEEITETDMKNIPTYFSNAVLAINSLPLIDLADRIRPSHRKKFLEFFDRRFPDINSGTDDERISFVELLAGLSCDSYSESFFDDSLDVGNGFSAIRELSNNHDHRKIYFRRAYRLVDAIDMDEPSRESTRLSLASNPHYCVNFYKARNILLSRASIN